jgi:photosystem II stability/assembly factor-like uncharacterized protein
MTIRSTAKSALITVLALSLTASAFAKTESAPKPLEGLEFRLLGPAVSGRMTHAAGVIGDANTFYASAAQGGLWKSEDAGRSWQPIFDEQDTQSVGAFAIAPSDANVIYVGSGEANIRGNVALGYGIWKSDDAGKSFSQILALKGQIGTIVVHPSNPDIAFAAVLGSPFGASEARGVYRTIDGGKRWDKVLYRNSDTGASDIAISERNPRVLFAGLWQARRAPWALTSGGPGSGLQQSRDGGNTWEELGEDAGLPPKPWGKVGVAIAPSDERRVYALIEAKNGGLFRSDDGGKSFIRINGERVLRQRAWYYSTMRIDPHNPNIIWFPQVGLLRSIDGGKTVRRVANTGHGDHHDVWIDPTDAKRIIEANDGGLGVTRDGGQSWHHPALPTGQFYNIDVDNRQPYFVGGTMQDMGTACGPSQVFRSTGVNLSDWRVVGGGEAGDFAFDPNQPGEIYAGEYGGYLSHFNEATGQTRTISSYPANPSGTPSSAQKYRFQWTAPVLASVHDGALYHGGNVLFRSTDQGASWTAISPDLTRNDKSKQGWSGGPITGDITTVEYFNTIFSLAESPDQAGLLYAGTDDGLLHISTDLGKNWRNITPKELPEWATIEAIHVPKGGGNTVFVVAHNYRLDDHAPYLFKSVDQGQRWTRLRQGLPEDLTLWSVRQDPDDANYLYLGTQRGVWYSDNAGASFQELALNLPKVSVTDLETKHGDLIVGTRGRAIWALENLAALRAMKSAQSSAVSLLPSAAALRFASDQRWGDESEGVLEAKDYGVNGHFWLREAFKPTLSNPIRLEVFDASGALVRQLNSIVKNPQYAEDDPDQPSKKVEPELTGKKGLNAFNWDLHANGARRLLKSKLDSGDAESGPLVPPGTYTLKLSVGANHAESTVTVLADPRSQNSAADIAADYAFARSVLADIDHARDIIEGTRALRHQLDAQLGALAAAAKTDSAEGKALSAAGLALRTKIDAIEGRLHNPSARVVYDVLAGRDGGAKLYNQLVPLYGWAQSADDAPTQGMRDRHAELQAQLKAIAADYQAVQAQELKQYREALSALGGVIAP